MAKSQQTFNKKEREKKRRKKRKEKLERRQQRKLEKEQAGKKTFEEQLSYLDADGNLTSTPPDPTKKKKEIKAEDIVIGIPSQIHVPEEIERTGKVKFFNDEKGFGFIIDAKSQDSIFVHVNNCAEPIQENDKVNFEIEKGPKGPIAVRVTLVQ
jgi:cold shock CspA family protein